MKLLAGRYGPYVTDGTTNASLPKGADPEALTIEQAVELLEARARDAAEEAPGAGAPAAPRKAAAARRRAASGSPSRVDV